MKKPTLTASALRDYRHKLDALAERLRGRIALLHDEALRPVQSSVVAEELDANAHEKADTAIRVNEQTVAFSLLNSEEHVLEETEAALGRLRQGTFGICEGCGLEIDKSRLEALPYARSCIECARKHESEQV
jgi:RNA polymerase-binding protein DksA